MDILLQIGLFVISIGVLLKGSDWFVDSAESIGLSMGISPYIIGVTIIAFGTSLPELASSIAAVMAEESSIVAANVVGSNITNIALVLGLTALVTKQIDMEYNIWHIDMPYLWGSAFLLYFMLADLHLDMFETIVLLLGIIIFLGYSFKGTVEEEVEERPKFRTRSLILLIIGGVFVWLGAKYVVEAIINISDLMNIESDKIALSAVALGTSLPEVVVSLTAARKGKASIAVGNVLGSNIFNTFIVMGVPSLFGVLEISRDIISFHIPLMIVMTILFGVMANNRKITRWEGCMLLMFYALFFAQLFK